MPRRTTPPAPYHHGDLRNALLRAALASDEPDRLSLRQLAVGLGVSPAAVYRHFENKEALMSELAGIGFDRLRKAFAAAFVLDEPPVDAAAARLRLQRLGEAYLAVAQAEPPLWRLMFGRLGARYRAQPHPGALPDTFQYLPAALLGLHRTGVLPSPPSADDVLFAWSVVHGLAGLRSGEVSFASGDGLLRIREMTERIIAGLGGRSSPPDGTYRGRD